MSHKNRASSNTSLKVAYIAAAATIIAAIIVAAFTFFSAPKIKTEGNCSGVFTGDIHGDIDQDCSDKIKP